MNLAKLGSVLLGGLVLTVAAHAGSYDDFFTAIKRNNGSSMKSLLESGFDPNTVDAQGMPGLVLSIKDDSEATTKALLASSAINVNIASSRGESALMMAAIRGDLPLVKDLLARGADVNKTGWSPLHYAVTGDKPDQLPIMRALLERHADINAFSPNDSTPLMMAAMYGSESATRLLVQQGANPLLKNQLGMTAADFARKANRESLAKELDIAAQAAARKQGQGTAADPASATQ